MFLVEKINNLVEFLDLSSYVVIWPTSLRLSVRPRQVRNLRPYRFHQEGNNALTNYHTWFWLHSRAAASYWQASRLEEQMERLIQSTNRATFERDLRSTG